MIGTKSDDCVAQIAQRNAGRDARVMAGKYTAMANGAFAFFRATAHLYHRRMATHATLRSPLGWMTGDLHLENFGVYKADNGLAYFDQNDFDESALLPAHVDLVRFLASILIGAKSVGVLIDSRIGFVRQAIEAYSVALVDGRALWCERETAGGPIGDLLAKAGKRKRRQFLAARTQIENGTRVFVDNPKRYLPLGPIDDTKAAITAAMGRLGEAAGDPAFYDVLDIKVRVAGLGSLGLPRYAVILRGRGSPDKNAIVDIKSAIPSSSSKTYGVPQPIFASEAERIVKIWRRAQAFSPAHLSAVTIENRAFVVRRLQPQEDRLDLAELASDETGLAKSLCTMARIAAWAHLRGAARDGSALPVEWIDYGRSLDANALVEAAEHVAEANMADYKVFAAAWKAGDRRLTDACKAQ